MGEPDAPDTLEENLMTTRLRTLAISALAGLGVLLASGVAGATIRGRG